MRNAGVRKAPLLVAHPVPARLPQGPVLRTAVGAAVGGSDVFHLNGSEKPPPPDNSSSNIINTNVRETYRPAVDINVNTQTSGRRQHQRPQENDRPVADIKIDARKTERPVAVAVFGTGAATQTYTQTTAEQSIFAAAAVATTSGGGGYT